MIRANWVSALFTAVLSLPLIVSAQSKQIDSQTYYKEFRSAYDASNQAIHRQTITEEDYENGKKVHTTTSLFERIPPDKTRSVHSYYLGKGLEQSTVIQVGAFYYCRDGAKPWKKSNNYCGQMTVVGDPADATVNYSTDSVELSGIHATVFTSTGTYHGVDDILRSFEEKFWIDEKGMLLRRERTTASEEGGVKYGRKTITTYEYKPAGLKIVAPIR